MKNLNFKKAKIYFLLALIVSTLFIFYAVARQSTHGLLKIIFLNVGEGNAILVRSPNGNQFLIDAGPDASIDRALGRVLPFYDRSLDAVIVTDESESDIGGMSEVLKNYAVREYVSGSATSTLYAYRDAQSEIIKNGIKTDFVKSGDTIDAGGGAYVKILDTNPIVAQIVYGHARFLIAGDASIAVQNYLAEVFGAKLKSDVLLVPHYGSASSLSSEFLSAALPAFSVISVDANNRFGYPDSGTLEDISAVKSDSMETYNGDIVFTADGETVEKR